MEYSVHYVVLHRCKHKALKWADYCTGLLHYITLKHTTCTSYLECIPQIPDRLSIWVLNHKTHFCASCSGVMWCVCVCVTVSWSCSSEGKLFTLVLTRVWPLSVCSTQRAVALCRQIIINHGWKNCLFSPPLFLPGSWPFTDFFSRIPSYCDTLIKDKAIFLVPRKKCPPEGPHIIFIYIPTLQFQGRDGTLRDVYMLRWVSQEDQMAALSSTTMCFLLTQTPTCTKKFIWFPQKNFTIQISINVEIQQFEHMLSPAKYV